MNSTETDTVSPSVTCLEAKLYVHEKKNTIKKTTLLILIDAFSLGNH